MRSTAARVGHYGQNRNKDIRKTWSTKVRNTSRGLLIKFRRNKKIFQGLNSSLKQVKIKCRQTLKRLLHGFKISDVVMYARHVSTRGRASRCTAWTGDSSCSWRNEILPNQGRTSRVLVNTFYGITLTASRGRLIPHCGSPDMLVDSFRPSLSTWCMLTEIFPVNMMSCWYETED